MRNNRRDRRGVLDQRRRSKLFGAEPPRSGEIPRGVIERSQCPGQRRPCDCEPNAPSAGPAEAGRDNRADDFALGDADHPRRILAPHAASRSKPHQGKSVN